MAKFSSNRSLTSLAAPTPINIFALHDTRPDV